MVGDATPSEPGNEQPRKKVLDLSALIAPPVSVETTIGKVFVYPPASLGYCAVQQARIQ